MTFAWKRRLAWLLYSSGFSVALRTTSTFLGKKTRNWRRVVFAVVKGWSRVECEGFCVEQLPCVATVMVGNVQPVSPVTAATDVLGDIVLGIGVG